MTIGIYKLNFKGTDKVYIGQSLNIETRITRHLNSFKIGTNSHKLMVAYNTYGYSTYNIIYECAEDDLDSIENAAIDVWDSVNNGFNTRHTATGKTSLVGEKAPASIYSNKQILFAFFILLEDATLLYRDIAEEVGVSRECVKAIAAGTRHKWIEKEYPKEYLILLSRQSKRNGSILERYGTRVELIHDNGSIEIIDNVRQFCLKHNLDDSHLGRVINGKAKSHKGWKLLSAS